MNKKMTVLTFFYTAQWIIWCSDVYNNDDGGSDDDAADGGGASCNGDNDDGGDGSGWANSK